MRLGLLGDDVFAHTGGRAWAASDTAVVLVHGAGNDHSVWRYQTRLLAGLGVPVLAVDLPGHGRSEGPPLTTVPAMGEWVLALLDTLDVTTATLVGHSMGSLIALAAAVADHRRVTRLGLVGTAARMGVHPDLQAAADALDPLAIDLIVGWSHTAASRFGGHRQAGMWTAAQTRRLLEANLPALGTDLRACAAFDAEGAARDMVADGHRPDVLVVSGERDVMTPPRSAAQLAEVLGARTAVVPDGSHVSVYDHPDAVNAALVPWLTGG